MFKKIALVLGAVVVVFLVVVAMQPADFRIVRSTVISAPPADVFTQVNDFHNWAAWSPWEKLDPAMKKSFSGAAAGVGAIYDWTGDDKVGTGRMTLTDSQPSNLIRINLEFLKPFEATSITEFVFAPDGGGTKVTWSMTGNNNFMAKAAGLFMNMEKMVGGDFEKGLAQLKTAAEAATKK
jgi:uncharacterized protein YndB with AHSA1/START domain